jgi:lysophospholipase L1-like esterase
MEPPISRRSYPGLGSILLLVAALTVSLAAIEIALRLFYPQNLSGSWAYLDDDNNLLNRSGGTVRHQLIDRPDHVVHYRFNSVRHRGHEEPSPTATRILVLGDSFTFGLGLQEDQTYVGLLQRNLDGLHLEPRVQLLNGGVAGWGTADEVAYLQKYGDQFTPRGLIIFVSIDDFRRAIRSNSFRIDAATGDIVRIPADKRGSGVKKFLQGLDFYNWLLEHSHLVQLARNVIVFGGGVGVVTTPGSVTVDESEQRAQQAIAHAMYSWIKRWCDARKIPLMVINNGWVEYPWLAEEMKGLGINFVDLRGTIWPVMQREGANKFFFRLDGHPNADGARLTGEAAWTALEPWFKTLDADGSPHHAE